MKSINMPCTGKWNLIVGEPPICVPQKNYLTKTLPQVEVIHANYASRHLNNAKMNNAATFMVTPTHTAKAYMNI